MTKIPLSLLFFTSTKGHFGFNDIYLATLNHLDRQVSLTEFDTKVAHIKVTPGEEVLGDQMEAELTKRGFKVLKTSASWSRGISHNNEYLRDMIKVSMEQSVYNNEHILFLEDDSTLQFHKIPLAAGLSRMIDFLKQDKELMTVRLLRRSDLSTSPVLQTSVDFFYSPHVNLQPLVMRSRDFYFMLKMIDDNMGSLSQTQIEMVWRLVLNPMSRSANKHIVFYPDYAETHHLGAADYPQIKASLGL